ncbi:HCNGP-like protein-domain-containing protein [Peziza echinospora]|nr:HCNGP-like protein-domain-containing protein [Peziza echinospora]
MQSLVSYDSDDDDDVEVQTEPQQPAVTLQTSTTSKQQEKKHSLEPERHENTSEAHDKETPIATEAEAEVREQVTIAHSSSRPPAAGPASVTPSITEPSTSAAVSELPIGPTIGPTVVGPAVGPTLPSVTNSPYGSYTSPSPSAPLSPYSLNRQQIQTLTLPHTIPPIPPSPPGTPPPETSNKFSNFLTLKRQGVHFNEKLSRSAALRNPRLLEKLMGFVGLDVSIGSEDAGGHWSPDQYISHLPPSVWDPAAWAKHEEGFIEKLRRSQQQVLEKRQKQAELDAARGQPRANLAFVGEKGTDYGTRKDGGTGASGAGAAAAAPRSAAERVMAGLDRSERAPPPARGGGDRGGHGRRNDGYDRDRDRDRDRRDGGGASDDHYRNRDRDRERDRERDRRKHNRSRSRSMSRNKDRNRDGYRR